MTEQDITQYRPTPFVAKIEGYGAIFHQRDDNGDVIMPGAFRKSIAGREQLPMLYQHDAAQPIGRWLYMKEDAHGLFLSGEIILRNDQARAVHALLEGGAIDGLSIGYKTIRAEKQAGGRRITQAELWEVSVVTFPMAPAARITEVGPPKAVKPHAVPGLRAANEAAMLASAVRAAAAQFSQ